MKEAARITSEAHRFLMESIGKGEVRDEGEAEGCFVGFCRKFGFVLLLQTFEACTVGLLSDESPADYTELNIKLILQ